MLDKAYVHFDHLFDLAQRGVFWVTRAKDNFTFKVHRKLDADKSKGILRDDIIELKGSKSKKAYPIYMRRVLAEVLINGKMVKMAFLTNNLDWAPSSVADLYQARWAIEVFFKEIKQTLKLAGFIGYSKNAIAWQVWADVAAINAAMATAGAFPLEPVADFQGNPLPTDDTKSAATLITLSTAVYTVVVTSADGGEGDVLVEAYEVY